MYFWCFSYAWRSWKRATVCCILFKCFLKLNKFWIPKVFHNTKQKIFTKKCVYFLRKEKVFIKVRLYDCYDSFWVFLFLFLFCFFFRNKVFSISKKSLCVFYEERNNRGKERTFYQMDFKRVNFWPCYFKSFSNHFQNRAILFLVLFFYRMAFFIYLHSRGMQITFCNF